MGASTAESGRLVRRLWACQLRELSHKDRCAKSFPQSSPLLGGLAGPIGLPLDMWQMAEAIRYSKFDICMIIVFE